MEPKRLQAIERKLAKPSRPKRPPNSAQPSGSRGAADLLVLQQTAGNQAVQRLLAQRSADGAFDLDDETSVRINRERTGGQPLDTGLQKSMGASLGTEMGSVRVHTSPEADALSHQLGAQAFTTGQDVFFREGAYDPHSSSGQELIAHELTHVVQQGSGAAGSSGGRMHVNAPGDAFEQQADAAADSLSEPGAGGVQMQAAPEEEEEVVRQQELDEEEEVGKR